MQILSRSLQKETAIKDKQIYQGVELQTGMKQFVPQNISTPFCENRYRIIAALAERCCYFCEKATVFYWIRCDFRVFSVLAKRIAAFLVRIRGPPSVI